MCTHSSQWIIRFRQGYLLWWRKCQCWRWLGEAPALLWVGGWCGRQTGCWQTQRLACLVACTLSCAQNGHLKWLVPGVSELIMRLCHILLEKSLQTLHIAC